MRTIGILPALILAATAVRAQGPGGQGQASLVEAATVERREVVTTRTFVGDVVAQRRSTIGAERAGLVAEFLVEEGQKVAEGEVLARLRTETLQIEIEASRASLDLRKRELDELVNGSRPEEILEAQAQVGAAQAALDLRTWRREKAEQLFESGTIPEDEVKEARLAERTAEEFLAQRNASLALVEAGPREERIAQARARIAVAEAEIRQLEDDLARHTVRAPFAGYVIAERTEVGQWLAVGSPVVDLAALDEVEVVVPVLEDDIAGVEVGLEASVRVPAVGDRVFTGRVIRIVPAADIRARTFPVRVLLKNEPVGGTLLLKAGMFARIEFPIGKKVDALLVPKDALVLGGPSPVVYVIDEASMTVRPLPVETGVAVDAMIQVKGPIQAGMKVVTKGNERLRPGQAVRLGTEG